MRAVSALLALALAGCDAAEAPKAALEAHALRLAGRDWRIDLPPGAELRIEGETAALDLTPGRRAQWRIALTPADAEALAAPFPNTATLPEGGAFTYETTSTEGGSGGPESVLRGLWRRDGAALRVTCHAQSDSPAPEPTWCLPYLRGLRPAD